ncbi:amidohydrolase family protein [Klebsiella michiganensis]|uniref:Amidohydrolase family protein n=1 Tax=Klebsiella michiganensis TaxID=1134687 RepID=A0A7H4PJN7_9ENTR|nr:amidohydrolase family protein [Klebsiella michiganensis]
MSDITQDHQPVAAFIQDFRHHMHRYPELSNEEVNTTPASGRHWRSIKSACWIWPLKTGLVAEIGGINPGELVVLRSDIDALPIERTIRRGLQPRKNPGVDARLRPRFPHLGGARRGDFAESAGRVAFRPRCAYCFRRRKETGHGAPALIDTGALDNAAVHFRHS